MSITNCIKNCDLIMKNTFIILIGYFFIPKISSDKIDSMSLPRNLLVGVSTSAFQTEGAWNVSGKGVSIWDAWTHNCPECIADHNTADDTCNSYYKYKEDIAIAKDIGFEYHRFSISWPRIFPNGFANKVNEEGLQHYKDVIKEFLANGLEPIVTLYHFDHPQILEDMGGWTNRMMVDWFADYARIIFKELGHMIKIFATINEPHQLCQGYSTLSMAPGKTIVDNIGYYLCIHNTLKAHARAYHIYDEEFRHSQHGQIGIISPCNGYVLDDLNDITSADTAFQFNCGVVSHPIYKGDYPPIVKQRLALVSKAQGYPKSRLPELTPAWISYIRGTSDYFGLNHYTSAIAIPDPKEAPGKYNSDSGVTIYFNSSWTHSSWVRIVPEGFRNLLRKIKEEYDNPPLYIFENGYAYSGISDYERIEYYRLYLEQMILAIKQDACRILRYTVWSLLDNFELSTGYSDRFGIVSVDFNSTNKDRTFKLSAFWWKELIRTRRIPSSFYP